MKLVPLSSKKLIKFLEKEGFKLMRQKGSHCIFCHEDGRRTVVPIHSNKKIGKGLLNSILSEIGIEKDEFIKKIKK